jgi:hypothetical protein
MTVEIEYGDMPQPPSGEKFEDVTKWKIEYRVPQNGELAWHDDEGWQTDGHYGCWWFVATPIARRPKAKFKVGEMVTAGVGIYTITSVEWSRFAGMWAYQTPSGTFYESQLSPAPAEPEKVTVKAWLCRNADDAESIVWLERPALIKGHWCWFVSNTAVGVDGLSLLPGDCRVVEVQVDAVAPSLEAKP